MRLLFGQRHFDRFVGVDEAVANGVVGRGVGWLNDNLDGMDSHTRAYALYSMAAAGQPNREAALALVEKVEELDTFSQSALALALWEAGERAEARAIVAGLAETAVTTADGKVHWPGDRYDGYYYEKTAWFIFDKITFTIRCGLEIHI